VSRAPAKAAADYFEYKAVSGIGLLAFSSLYCFTVTSDFNQSNAFLRTGSVLGSAFSRMSRLCLGFFLFSGLASSSGEGRGRLL